jgi:hypothetical protein
VLDFETNPSLDVTVQVDDATIFGAPDDSDSMAISVTDVNDPPSVTLTPVVTTISEDADTSSAIKVADIVVADDALGTNLLSLSGDDAALFEIVGTELFLKAGTVLDFETDTSLDVTVEVDDAAVGATPDDTDSMSITVTNVNDVAPTVTLTSVVTTLAEDADTTSAIKVADILVSDVDGGTNLLSLSGADAALFEIVGTELFLKAGTVLDFEMDTSLDVNVDVDDATLGGTPDDTDSLSIAVTNVNDVAPTVSLTPVVVTLAEDFDTSSAIKVANILVTDDGLGTNNLSLSGADVALFEIIGTELFLKAGAVLDFETNPLLDVTVEVDDATIFGAPDDSDSMTITITDVVEGP